MKKPGVIGWTSSMVAEEAQEQRVFVKAAERPHEPAKKCGIDAAGLAVADSALPRPSVTSEAPFMHPWSTYR